MRTATTTSVQGDHYTKLAAALRDTGTGWQAIDGTAHEPLGITIGVITSDSIEVLFPAGLQVCWMLVGPDETLASPPYSAVFGASVGLNRAIIKGTVGGVQFNPLNWLSQLEASDEKSANIWLAGELLKSA